MSGDRVTFLSDVGVHAHLLRVRDDLLVERWLVEFDNGKETEVDLAVPRSPGCWRPVLQTVAPGVADLGYVLTEPSSS